jgi:hypothetical protein
MVPTAICCGERSVIRRKSSAYRVEQNRLMVGEEELLSGPLLQLEHFAAVLNLVQPEDDDIAPLLRILFSTTPDCSYAVGPRLLADGTPLRMITPQRRKPKGAS